jgi:hypothetical protein
MRSEGLALRHVFTSVAGVTYPNRDGTKRQTIITKCRIGESIVLEAEPDNPQRENAVRVLRKDGSQIGYVASRMATQLVADLAGLTAFVAGIDDGGPHLEVSLLLVLNEGGNTAAVESYARELLQRRPRAGQATRAPNSVGPRRSCCPSRLVVASWKLIALPSMRCFGSDGARSLLHSAGSPLDASGRSF